MDRREMSELFSQKRRSEIGAIYRAVVSSFAVVRLMCAWRV